MGNTPEGAVKDKIRAWLKNSVRPCWHYCPVHTGMGVAGIPDIVGCDEGLFFGIEVKAPGKLGTLRPAQLLQLEAIGAAGGKWFLVDSLGALVEEFTRWRASRC